MTDYYYTVSAYNNPDKRISDFADFKHIDSLFIVSIMIDTLIEMGFTDNSIFILKFNENGPIKSTSAAKLMKKYYGNFKKGSKVESNGIIGTIDYLYLGEHISEEPNCKAQLKNSREFVYLHDLRLIESV